VATESTIRLKSLVAGLCAGLGLVALSMPASADSRLSWFGETNFTGAYPNLDSRDITDGSTEWLKHKTAEISSDRFSIDRYGSYRALSSIPIDGALRASDLDPVGNRTEIQSEFGFSVGRESFAFPMEVSKSLNKDRVNNSLGVKWRHQFGDSNHLTLSALYGTSQSWGDSNIGGVSSSKLASVSWTSAWPGVGERAITGSLFFGDEQASTSSVDASRQIYGLSVGGKWAISANHTPFISYRYQSGIGDAAFTTNDLFQFDNATYLSAGWNWQIKSNWSVQAEADFAYQQPTLDLFNVNSTRLFFRTRYDLR
jgi:hypothetical protein